MRIFNGLEDVPADFGPSVVTIGNFDGVHRGHQEVLRQLVRTGWRYNAQAVAITFAPHPLQIHAPQQAPEMILGAEDKYARIAASGIDALVVIKYSLEFAQATAEEFVKNVIVDTLKARAVVVGHDVRFGKGNTGDFACMEQLGVRYGFDVQGIDDFGEVRRCSSTWVRELLAEGDVAGAADVLGRPHMVRGTVVHGAARGRELGFPTANLSADSIGLIPADGVYAGWLIDESDRRWPAAISVGTNPTFDGVERTVESHVIDRPLSESIEEFNLYGQEVVVEFVERLRGMVAYRGVEALIVQMHDDVAKTREVLAKDMGHRLPVGRTTPDKP